MGEQVGRGHLRARFHGAAVLGKAPHHGEAIGPLSRLRIGRLRGPAQRQVGGDEARAFTLGEDDEALQ